ncbi:hypothetical protein BH11PLA1_BH11PLA1_16290 [soil metagenome]
MHARSLAAVFAVALAILVDAGGDGAGAKPATGPRTGDSVGTVTGLMPGALTTAIRGRIPIIISAPHGGMVRVPGSRDRASGVTVRDVNTAEIALLVSQRLTERLGGKPYVVIAQFSRKDADANRARGEACETDAARREYDAYHATLRAFVDECRATGQPALLVDLHGQVRAPEAAVRGTRDGKSLSALRARAGDEAIIGPKSLFGRLKAAGIPIVPDPDAPRGPDEANAPLGLERYFNGGYITDHYGAHNADGIDALQIELGAMRSDAPWKTARTLGDAIADFANDYLLAKRKSGESDKP